MKYFRNDLKDMERRSLARLKAGDMSYLDEGPLSKSYLQETGRTGKS
jgi:hypothetical protein